MSRQSTPLPYRWYPDGAHTLSRPPGPGALLAHEHAVYEVLAVVEVPRVDWTETDWEKVRRGGSACTPIEVELRQVSGLGDDRGRMRCLRARGDLHVGERGGTTWQVYDDEHWPACGRCCEPVPCRERAEAAYIEARMVLLERFSMPGVCPACREPVTGRQRAVTFPENVEVPAGPPVTYHLGRSSCRRAALDYQDRWVAAARDRTGLIGEHDPYGGKPNPAQRQLLALAAQGELECRCTRVVRARPGDDLTAMMHGWDARAEAVWYPTGLSAAQQRELPPLIQAGLIAQPDVCDPRGGRRGRYRLTADGREAHRKFPASPGSLEAVGDNEATF